VLPHVPMWFPPFALGNTVTLISGFEITYPVRDPCVTPQYSIFGRKRTLRREIERPPLGSLDLQLLFHPFYQRQKDNLNKFTC